MAARRDTRGRFARKPLDQLTPAYRRRTAPARRGDEPLAVARGHGLQAPATADPEDLFRTPTYERVLEALTYARSGMSPSEAARRAHTTVDAMQRLAPRVIGRRASGRYTIAARDSLRRRVRFLDEYGEDWIEPATSQEATKVARHWVAVKHYLHTGDAEPLQRFRRMRLRTRDGQSLPFVTDPATLELLARAGELEFSSLYQVVS
ncbi:MAG: hypothetical protein CL878_13590 [Dehalococcoidia bacterium]|nr:hypothetical protein [Dehalococcoidia bacterium]